MDYLKALKDSGVLQGEYDAEKVSGLTPEWFWTRQTDFLDFRGNLRIHDPAVLFGRHIRIITASHSIAYGRASPGMVKRRVIVEKYVFVGSYALLYNCRLREGCVVNCGCVVSNVDVPPYTMVEGNPARMIGKFINGMWHRMENPPFLGEYLNGMRYWERKEGRK